MWEISKLKKKKKKTKISGTKQFQINYPMPSHCVWIMAQLYSALLDFNNHSLMH